MLELLSAFRFPCLCCALDSAVQGQGHKNEEMMGVSGPFRDVALKDRSLLTDFGVFEASEIS